jgi:galactose-1-phosphate uridylyltransferase
MSVPQRSKKDNSFLQCTSNRMATPGPSLVRTLCCLLLPFLFLTLSTGYEDRGNGKCSLFIFDPNHHGTTFKTKLEERRGWQMMLKRGGHTLRRNEYQIVQVLPGLMEIGSEEYERSKTMTSERF